MGKKLQEFVLRNLLTIMTVCGVLAGTALGVLLRATLGTHWGKREVMYLAFPGEIFLRMLKCLIIPLLMSSVIQAIGSLDLSLSKKIAIRSIVYYATTTICAVILGIFLVLTIRPGVGGTSWTGSDSEKKITRHVLTQDTLLDLIRLHYPKEIQDFNEKAKQFKAINCQVISCSFDSLDSHLALVKKIKEETAEDQFEVILLSDTNHQISNAFNVDMVECGNPVTRVFIINPKGIILMKISHKTAYTIDVNFILQEVKNLQTIDMQLA